MRRKQGAHLSREGIELARLVGSTSGPFSLVVTSTIPRAVETAIAMGFEVHETLDALRHLPSEVFDEVGWPRSFLAGCAGCSLGGASCEFRRRASEAVVECGGVWWNGSRIPNKRLLSPTDVLWS